MCEQKNSPHSAVPRKSNGACTQPSARAQQLVCPFGRFGPINHPFNVKTYIDYVSPLGANQRYHRRLVLLFFYLCFLLFLGPFYSSTLRGISRVRHRYLWRHTDGGGVYLVLGLQIQIVANMWACRCLQIQMLADV